MEKTRVVVHAAVQFALSRIKECKKELSSEMNKISTLILTNATTSSRRAEKKQDRQKKSSVLGVFGCPGHEAGWADPRRLLRLA